MILFYDLIKSLRAIFTGKYKIGHKVCYLLNLIEYKNPCTLGMVRAQRLLKSLK